MFWEDHALKQYMSLSKNSMYMSLYISNDNDLFIINLTLPINTPNLALKYSIVYDKI